MSFPTAPRAVSAPGHVAVGVISMSLASYWSAAVAGPSVVSHELRGSWLPPYSLGLHPSPWLAVALLWLGTLLGGVGTLLALRALRSGWTPRPTALLAGAVLAVVAFALVPPVNSDDVYSYAAYGRMVAVGRNPYTTAPDDLPGDPVAQAVTPPWRDTPTAYGPIATAEQAAVMRLAGRSVRWGVLGLGILGALAFAATAGLLHRYAADAAAQRRAAVCWALNPLLIFQLVGGAHVDAVGSLALVAAVVLLASRKFAATGASTGAGAPISSAPSFSAPAAGVAAGAAIAVKLTGGLAAIGLAWSLRRTPRRLAQFVAGGVLIVVPAYLLAGGLTALQQVRRASRFVSHASWWRPLAVRLDAAFGAGTSRQVISTAALAALVTVACLLGRALPPQRDGIATVARWALAPTLAWLLTATYLLPWYAALAWPLIALIAASRWDELLLVWTVVLTLAYIPGRDVALPPGLAGITRWLRAGLGPIALAGLLVVALWWVWSVSSRAASTEAAA